ncbi:MAG TPA: hypothetical protein V6D08_16975 [Candidatus Obscuribacterales bacterium]
MTAHQSHRHSSDAVARPHNSGSSHESYHASGRSSSAGSYERHAESAGGDGGQARLRLHEEVTPVLSGPEGRTNPIQHAATVDFSPAEKSMPPGGSNLDVTPVHRAYSDDRTASRTDGRESRAAQYEQTYFGPHDRLPPVDDGETPRELVRDRFLEQLEDFTNPPGKKPPDITVVYESKDPSVPGPKPDYIVDKDGMVHSVNNGAQNDGHIVIQVERPDDPNGAPNPQQQVIIDGLVDYTARQLQLKYGDQLEEVKTKDGVIKQVEIHDHQNLVTDAVEQKYGNKLPPELQVPGQPPVPEVPPGVGEVTDPIERSRGSGAPGTIPRESFDRQIPRQEPVPQDVVPPVAALENTTAAMFNPEKDHPYETVRHREGIGYQVGRYGLNEGLVGGWLAEFLPPELLELLGNPPDWSKLGKILKEHPELRKGFQKGMKEALNKRAEQLKKQPGMEESAKNLNEFADKFNDENFAQNFGDFVSKLGGHNGKIDSEDAKRFMPKELQEFIAKDRTEEFAREVMRQRGVENPDPDNLTPQDAGKVALAWFLGRVPEKDSPDWSNPQYQEYMRRAEDFYKLARAGQFGTGDFTVANGDILAAAEAGVGKRMWALSSTAGWTENGNLGCAAALSEVLQRAGVNVKDTALAANLAHQLTDNLGWKRIPATVENMKKYPSSVVYGHSGGWNDWGGGGNAHIGIVGETVDGRVWVYDNSSATRVWTHRPLQESSFVPGNARFGNNMWILVPPAAA